MNERTSRKIPVTERQFLWVQDDDKGEVTLHVGPTMVSPTAADRVVEDDGQGGFREDTRGRPQLMIELGDNQYAMLSNPLVEVDGTPNGKFKQGRNESRPLRNGTRSMIPGPCSFYLRPGQNVDVRDAHQLASNQYLVVKVYGEVDRTAPFYDVTARSAGITRATAENTSEDSSKAPLLNPNAQVELKRGQLIVIRGLDTQFYIPPTGVDIVPDISIDDSGTVINAAAARQLLSQHKQSASDDAAPEWRAEEPLSEPSEDGYAAKGMPRQQVPNAVVDQSARNRHRKVAAPSPSPSLGANAMPPAPPVTPAPSLPSHASAIGALHEQEALAAGPIGMGDAMLSSTFRRALEREARQARLVRRAVVLGEKEYCVIVDADGKREIKVGPARVFPGPYDTFMTIGSRHRVYDAYELLPQRALWLRVIAPISKATLADKLPRGVQLDKSEYFPGDEILLTGVSTFFFPFNEIEVLSPATGQAVVGNDHTHVFIEAIGIDQKSGIYVRDLADGEVRLIRGKQSYLVDPRKEVQVTRTVSREDWNLWVAASEPHKVAHAAMTTPWALSVTVPNNTAVLVTSHNARRVVQGPCVTLLGYEESLSSVLLSTGTPKSDEHPLRTAFLRTIGNRVSDIIHVETSDFVRIALRVSYSARFAPEAQDRWFNQENYIQVMVEHLRSIVRGRLRTLSLSEVWPKVSVLVRDTVLGEKKDAGRPGRVFAENGMVVDEVEVLSATIEDAAVAELMRKVQTDSVTLTIGDRKAQESLASAKLRATIDLEQQRLAEEARVRTAKLEELTQRLAHEAALTLARAQASVVAERQALEEVRLSAELKARLARESEAKTAELLLLDQDSQRRAAANRVLAAAEVERLAKLRELEVLLINAQSAATVAERNAVQKGLVEAMTALGDKLMLSEVAQNMNLVSLFKGKDVGAILTDVVGGTKVMPTVQAMVERFAPGANHGQALPAKTPNPAS